MTVQISQRGKAYLETARAAQIMTDNVIAGQPKALADEMNDHFWHAALVVLAVMLPISTIGLARAHDYQHPELNGWYESLHSGKGPCCDGSDAKRVDDADWETKDGHYRVRVDGEWVDVPNDAVVDGPNRAGRTMVWPYYRDSHPIVRCFMPGSMG